MAGIATKGPEKWHCLIVGPRACQPCQIKPARQILWEIIRAHLFPKTTVLAGY